MRVVVCWSTISGYMAACWRELAAQPGIELFVIARAGGANAQFHTGIMGSIPCRLLASGEDENIPLISSLVNEFRPDVVILCGWYSRAYRSLAFNPALSGVRFIMGMDTPRKDTWRQRLARLKIGRFLDRMDAVVVAGERSWQLARFYQVPEEKLFRGYYAYDDRLFVEQVDARLTAGPWPRRFLFVGRYVPEKGIDTLLRAYARYRQQVSDPWPLTCCGMGPLAAQIHSAIGVEDRGFVQPAGQPTLFLSHGVFVLPSVYEPWGVVIAEAAATGLPVICTEACGASVEIVRTGYNGLVVPTADEGALFRALTWAHENHDQLPEMGRRAAVYARAHSATRWGQSWRQIIGDIAGA